MTTVAISGLPVATVINAADIVPFVQAGTTKSISKTLLFTSPTIATPTMTGPILGTVTSGNISACTSTSMILTTPVLSGPALGTVASGNISNCLSTGMVLTTPTMTGPVLGVATATSLTAAGNVLVSSSAGKTGYTTGTGSTVVQATSRTTTVLLNRPTGSITLFSAAGSTTAATFTVSNNIVTATDVIILNQKSGTDLYDLMVTAVGAGSFNITFRTTGGTTTETPVFSFAVISGAVT
jgi:hypothetical protein